MKHSIHQGKGITKTDKDTVEQTLDEFSLYGDQSQDLRRIWGKCYEAYKSSLETSKNPYLSNIYLPKTHEAVELLNAFLIGNKHLVRAKGADKGDAKKALPVQKLLQYQWQKELRAYDKIETWVKQGILFGTSVMKCGWLDDADKELDIPFIEPIEISRFYCDFYVKDIQDQHSVIHEIVSTEDNVKNNASYTNKKGMKNLIIAKDSVNNLDLDFDASDNAMSSYTDNTIKKVRLLERWTAKKIITIAEVADGWVKLREDDNPYGFIPFVKFVYKTPPLSNRFYGIGAIEPTLILQKAINSTMNQMFDNISLINQSMYLKRRGASINPQDTVARPGGIIEVTDIEKDIKQLQVSDIKGSIQMLSQMLNSEFQEASGAVALLKGLGGGDTATEAALQQKNVTTVLDKVIEHFHVSLSELGQMLIEINLYNISTNKTIKIMEDDNKEIWLEVSPEEINGKFDIDVQVDRTAQSDRLIMSKQLIDFLAVASKNPQVMQQVDIIPLFKKWLELQGFADVEDFFKKAEMPQGLASLAGGPTPGTGDLRTQPEMPKIGEELGQPGLQQSGISPVIQ